MRERTLMFAVDHEGNELAIFKRAGRRTSGAEVVISPNTPLTSDLLLAVVVASPLLHLFWYEDTGGGG
jgi:hypothetical protein